MIEIQKRVHSYRRKFSHLWKVRRAEIAAKRRNKIFSQYISMLAAKPAEVLIGANLEWGGVRHHLHAIKRYSSLNVNLVPGEELFDSIGASQIGREFYELFSTFSAAGTHVVHSHVLPWYIEWCREQQIRGKRWIHTYHSHYSREFSHNGKLKPWQESCNEAFINVAGQADMCLSVSKWQAEMYSNHYGIDVIYLPNGVDVSKSDSADASRFIRKSKLSDFILYVGRNDPVKNPADFVRLADRLPEFQFVMIGKDLSSEVLRTEWQVDSPRNLRVFGSMTHEDIQDAIAACSVLVVTSKREGMPTLVLEAMVQGKAVVVPDELGCMEAINHGEVGHIYAQGDIDELERKVLLAKSDSRFGGLARQRVLSEYDWRIIAPRLDDIYQGNGV